MPVNHPTHNDHGPATKINRSTKVVRINGNLFSVTVDPIVTASSVNPRYRITPVGASHSQGATFHNADDALDYMSDYQSASADKLALDMVSPLQP